MASLGIVLILAFLLIHSVSALVQQGRQWEYLQSLAQAQQLIHSEASPMRHLHKRMAQEPAEKVVDQLLEQTESIDVLPGCTVGQSPPVKPFNTSHPEHYEEARKFALYSAAAYCQPARLHKWQCGSRCVGSDIPNNHRRTRLLLYLKSKGSSDTTGYMALEESITSASQPRQKPRLIIAFQGSLSVHHWISNLRVFPLPFPVRDSTWKATFNAQCKNQSHDAITCQPHVHQGFLAGHLEVADTIRNMTVSMLKLYPDLEIICTGHSLGGALAVLTAVDLHDYLGQLAPPRKLNHAASWSGPFASSSSSRPIGRRLSVPVKAITVSGASSSCTENVVSVSPRKILVYTYGQPRIGNRAFADYVRSRLGITIFRINYHTDPVPHLPPRLLGYRHHQNEIWITVNGDALQCAALADQQPKSNTAPLKMTESPLPFNATDDAAECRDDDSESGRCAHSLHLIQLNILSHIRIWDVFFGPFC